MTSTKQCFGMYLLLLATLCPIGVLCMPLRDVQDTIQNLLSDDSVQTGSFKYADIQLDDSATGSSSDNVSHESAYSSSIHSSSSGEGSSRESGSGVLHDAVFWDYNFPVHYDPQLVSSPESGSGITNYPAGFWDFNFPDPNIPVLAPEGIVVSGYYPGRIDEVINNSPERKDNATGGGEFGEKIIVNDLSAKERLNAGVSSVHSFSGLLIIVLLVACYDSF
eukprot:scpid93283/ scgid6121/ 